MMVHYECRLITRRERWLRLAAVESDEARTWRRLAIALGCTSLMWLMFAIASGEAAWVVCVGAAASMSAGFWSRSERHRRRRAEYLELAYYERVVGGFGGFPRGEG